MPITGTDLKLKKAERMTDFDDGGGRMTSNEVVDGQLNNVFSDISDLDRVVGRLSLRKIYAHVDADNVDELLGVHVIVTERPTDPGVHVSLMSDGSFSSERTDAKERVERYLVEGPPTRLGLYGNLVEGMNLIQLYCRQDVATPDIGDVLILSQEAEGYPEVQQYIRVREVLSRITQSFEDDGGVYYRDVMLVEIQGTIAFEFEGLDVPPRLSSVLPPTLVRQTSFADAARYYSITPVVVQALEDDFTVQVESPYQYIVPSTTQEVPQVDVLAGLGTVSYVASSAVDALTLSASTGGTIAANAAFTRYLGNPLVRGSVSVLVGTVLLVDDGAGSIEADDPLETGWTGEIDYGTGAISIARDVSWSAGSINYTGTAAGAISQQGFSDTIAISIANRGIAYVYQVPNTLAPGTLLVDYLALGKWVRLTDNGAGQLTGNPGEGSGTVNYATGSVAITLGALPDVDSDIVLSWGTPNRAQARYGDLDIEDPAVAYTVAEGSIRPGTLTISWLEATVAKSCTDDGEGNLTGDATGRVVYATGETYFRPTNLPDVGSSVDYDYDSAIVLSDTQTPTPVAGSVTFTIPDAPIKPGSVFLRWNAENLEVTGFGVERDVVPVWAMDDGLGSLISAISGTTLDGTNTINYATGEVTLQVEQTRKSWVPVFSARQNASGGKTCMYVSSWTIEDVGLTFTSGTPINISYTEDSATPTTESESIPVPPVQLDLAPTTTETIVPGSVRFTFRGRTYVDRAGTLVHSVNATNNSGTPGGTISYSSGIALIDDYTSAGANTATLTSLLTQFRETGVSGVFFRTPGAPLKAGVFTIRATELDSGTLITGTADINGVVTGTRMIGQVDWDTGLVRMAFGEMVTAAGNEAEPWYDADWIVGGNIWKPSQVEPTSIFVGCVILRSIPLDPGQLGIDPVRLPPDGRVLFIRPGNVAVIHNTIITEVASPAADDVTDLGRERLSYAIVRDAEGVLVDGTWFTTDLDAGTVTWSNPLNLAAYTLPIYIEHRIEDMALVSDVQITGEVGLARALSHTFPETGTYLSTALTAGSVGPADLQARVANLFAQNTWTGEWSDDLIGDAPAADYNDLAYPLAVSNQAAVTERWRIQFTAPTVCNVIGETLGVVATGVSITGDIAPVNPLTTLPYFTIDLNGWGGGWASGNVLRFNTVGAALPIWALRTTLQGPPLASPDSARVQFRGNAA